MNKPDECSLCCVSYDEREHRPRTLPCGHSFCSPCIVTLIASGHLSCPDCRTSHPTTSIDQFPISYGMEVLMKQLKEARLTKKPETASTEIQMQRKAHNTLKKRLTGMSKKLQSLLEEQTNSLSSLIIDCQDTQSQLDQYQTPLADWKDQHLQLQDKLLALVEQNKLAVMLIEQENANVAAMRQEGQAKEKEMEALLGCLQEVNTAQEADTAIDHADLCRVKVEDWRQKCQELFPNISTLSTSQKVREVTRMALETVSEKSDATPTPDLLLYPDPTSAIMEKVKDMTGLLEKVTVQDLRGMNQSVKRLVEAGHLVAVQEDHGRYRSSRITLENGRIYLHCLLDQLPPPHNRTLPVRELMAAIDPSSTIAYLDLAWGGSTRGRVHIKLIPDTPVTKQFILLCTGQRGHSYRNTRMFRVDDKGRPGERVMGGDYDGKGGESLDTLSEGQYRKSGKAGTMSRVMSNDVDLTARFSITTKDHSGSSVVSYTFGEVESGLDVVRAAASLSDITQVTVVDCGIVFSQ